MNLDWKKIISTVAPVLGTALGGPLAGSATKFIADNLLGKPDATDEQIEEAVCCMRPEELIKLKELDASFAAEMKKLDVDVYRIDANDRASARDREKTIKDITPSVLAYMLIAGFFLIVWRLLTEPVANQTEQIVLSTISNLLLLALSYYFGSSNKDRDLNKK